MTGSPANEHPALRVGPEPQRIVCLTEETTETLYRLGEQDRIVGISTFTVRPPEARRDKPIVSQFIKADLERILEVQPDLVLAFSDLQADICAGLIRAGVPVHCFNQRSVPEILAMIRMLGGMVGAAKRAEQLVAELLADLRAIAAAAAAFPRRPRVYFEEWPDPTITGIRWVMELVEIAGGDDVFPEFRHGGLAAERTVQSFDAVLERNPEVMLASWCGKKFRPDQVRKRPGWADLPLTRDDRMFAIDSATILQPGPGALTDGVREIHRLLADVVGKL